MNEIRRAEVNLLIPYMAARDTFNWHTIGGIQLVKSDDQLDHFQLGCSVGFGIGIVPFPINSV
jgi:hypothetical protein